MLATLLVPWPRPRLFERSRRHRKSVEMLFAHLKRILRLGRLRLRGPCGAQDEFTLAAIAQNLRRLAKLVARPPPAADGMSCVAGGTCQCLLISVTAPQRADGENPSEGSRQQPCCYDRSLLQQNRHKADITRCPPICPLSG